MSQLYTFNSIKTDMCKAARHAYIIGNLLKLISLVISYFILQWSTYQLGIKFVLRGGNNFLEDLLLVLSFFILATLLFAILASLMINKWSSMFLKKDRLILVFGYSVIVTLFMNINISEGNSLLPELYFTIFAVATYFIHRFLLQSGVLKVDLFINIISPRDIVEKDYSNTAEFLLIVHDSEDFEHDIVKVDTSDLNYPIKGKTWVAENTLREVFEDKPGDNSNLPRFYIYQKLSDRFIQYESTWFFGKWRINGYPKDDYDD